MIVYRMYLLKRHYWVLLNWYFWACKTLRFNWRNIRSSHPPVLAALLHWRLQGIVSDHAFEPFDFCRLMLDDKLKEEQTKLSLFKSKLCLLTFFYRIEYVFSTDHGVSRFVWYKRLFVKLRFYNYKRLQYRLNCYLASASEWC